MASMRPQLPILQTHNDLDPRIRCDSRIELVDETVNLDLPTSHNLKLGTGLQPEHHDILAPTLIANVDLFA